MGDPGVAALAAGNPELRVVRVDHCSKVSDVSMVALAHSCRRLQVHFAPHTLPTPPPPGPPPPTPQPPRLPDLIPTNLCCAWVY